MAQDAIEVQRWKEEIRARAHANRREQPNKDGFSGVICEKLAALPEFAAAETVIFYVSFGNEVRTRRFLLTALGEKKRIVVPYCSGEVLELFRLASLDELSTGTFGILEPKSRLRKSDQRRVKATEIDLVVVPGVAFDRDGGRVGHGKGYYDKLLKGLRPDALLVGLAFECQIFPQIPMLPRDVFMDKVITEEAIYLGRSRRATAEEV